MDSKLTTQPNSAPETSTDTAGELFHLSLNPTAPSSIVLLHGLSTSHREWLRIATYLSDFHLLIVDLPSHSRSRNIPFTLESSTASLATLIRTHAHSSTTHVVGFSGGGYLALHLAHAHPSLITSLFLSGVYNLYPRRHVMRFAQNIAWLGSRVPDIIYELVSGIRVKDLPEGLREDTKENDRPGFLKGAFEVLMSIREGWPVECRTLVIAAGKHDDVEETRKLGVLLRKGNEMSKAVLLKGAVHPWGLVDPELFAKCVKAWIEKEELPKELVPLE